MNLRTAVTIILSAVSILLSATSAQAQIRSSRSSQTRSGLNPIHEQTKNEAQKAYKRGEYQRTIDLTSSVLRANSRDDVAYYLRASARVEIGLQQGDGRQIRNGIADAREAIRLKGRENPIYYIPYFYGMTSLSMLENRDDHAKVTEEYVGKVIAQTNVSTEDKAHLHYQRGRARVYLKKYDDAISDFKTAIQLAPTQIGFHIDLADAYARAERPNDALQTYQQTLRRFPDEPVVYNNRGMFLQRQEKTSEAVADFTRALELNPQYYYAYTNRGFALLQSGDAAAAINDLNMSLQINPNQPSAYGLRASARLEQGRISEAIADHQQTLKLSPNNAVAHADLGYARFFAGDYSAARKSFDKAVELDTQRRYLNPWRYLTMALAGEGDAARTKFAELTQADPKKRDWIDHLLAYLSGQIGDDELIGSVNDKPGVKTAQICEAHFFIAQRHAMAGESQIAADHFRQAIATGQKQLAAFRGANFALKNVSVSNTSRSGGGN